MARTVAVSLTANTSGFVSGMTKAGAAAKGAAKSTESLSAAEQKLVAAQRAVANATGAVRTAQAKLDGVIASGTANVAKRIAAEERLAKSARALGAAQKAASEAAQGASKGGFLDRVNENSANLRTVSTAVGVAGLALAAGVGAAVKSAAQFDQGISKVAATGDDARQNLDALRQAAIDAGASTQFSATEAAQGLEELAKAGVSAKDSLGGGLKGSLDLAAAGGIGVGEAAETAASAMTQFNIEGSKVPHIADLLAAGAGKAQGDVSDLGQALKQSGLVAAQTGLSIEDTTGSLAAFASAGLLGSDAGTSFKTMLQSLTPRSKQAAEAMKEIGLNAYDAQGNFIGITAVADQLKTGLSKLTVEQQASALKTIFGSDAVRAATVLYKEGGAGIQSWIDKVDDSGYAAETAATRMDNLNGDLEQLRGAFETALIGLGEGAQGPLRTLTQELTRAVNLFNGLSDAPKAAITVVAAVGAAGLLASAGLAKAAVSAAELNTALLTMGPLGVKAAAGVRAVGAAGVVAGAAAVAIGVVTASVSALSTKAGDVDAVSHSLLSLANNAGKIDLTAAFPEPNFFDHLTGAISGMNGGLTDLNDILQITSDKGFQGATNKYREFIEGILPGTQTLERYRGELTNVDAALAKLVNEGRADEAAAAFKKLADQAGKSPEELKANFGQYAAALDGATDAANQADPAISALQTALDSTADSGADAAKALDDLSKSLFTYGNQAQQLAGDQIAVEAAIDAVTKAVKDNGKNTDINTKKGRDNRSALLDLASTSKQYVENLTAQGKSTAKVTAATQSARTAFISAAEKMGFTAKQAKTLADRYGLIPRDVKTKVSAPGADESRGKVESLRRTILETPSSKTVKIQTSADTSTLISYKRTLDGIQSRSVTFTTNYRTTGSPKPRVPTASANAAGGFISGPGNSISDSIPAWLSNGEYVIRAAAVKAVGIANLHSINAMGGPQRAFAAGGPVSVSSFGTSKDFSVSSIVSLIRFVENIKGSLAKLTDAVEKAQRGANVADKAAAAPRAAYLRADSKYDDAVKARNAARLDRAEERKDDQDKIARLKKRADATKGITAADRKYRAAQAAAAKDTREYSVELAKLNKRVTDTSKDKSKAEDVYKKAADKSKAASDKLKDAQAALVEQQKAVADGARSISDQFRDAYSSQSADVKDIIELRLEGAKDLKKFRAQIVALRKLGVNESDVQDIISRGAINGGDLASQILKGGKSLVDSLNKANQGLQDAADVLGYTGATVAGRVKAYASGGPVVGAGTTTSDSIAARLSNGEYVVNAAATAANRAALDAMNYGRKVIEPARQVQSYRYGGYVTHPEPQFAPSGDSYNFNGPMGAQPEQVVRIIDRRRKDAFTMRGLRRVG